MAPRPAALLIILTILHTTACTSPPLATVDLGDSVEVTSEYELVFSEPFTIKSIRLGDPDSPTEIVWGPVYTIANHGEKSIELRDISPHFPPARSVRDGSSIELTKIRPTETFDVYHTTDELRDHEPSATIKPPLTLEPGSRMSVRTRQEFEVRNNGRALWSIRPGDNLADYLGLLFGLAKLPNGRYQCVARADIEVTISTNFGDVQKQANQPICMSGAEYVTE